MVGSADGRMRLTILGGFLGAGKTTWLRHQLHHGLAQDALVVINEVAAVPVDNALLTRSSRRIVLAGGCACCEGREAFISLLRDVCDARVSSDDPADRIDRIVLETSGLADPGTIIDAIKFDPVLRHHIVVRASVLVFDQLYFALQAALDSLGVALIPAALVEPDVRGGRLCVLAEPVRAVSLHYALLSPRISAKRKLIRTFGRWLGRST
jgi:G3E family GTPase